MTATLCTVCGAPLAADDHVRGCPVLPGPDVATQPVGELTAFTVVVDGLSLGVTLGEAGEVELYADGETAYLTTDAARALAGLLLRGAVVDGARS